MLRKFSNRPIKILLFVLLVLLCVYGVFYSTHSLSCDIDSSFSWKAYSYTPVTDRVPYNYAFPSEEISITAEDQNSILQMLMNSKIQRRFPGSWTPYGLNTRIPCALALEIENTEMKYVIFLCGDASKEFLLLKIETYDANKWYNLKNPELLQYLSALFPYDNIGNPVTHVVGKSN